MPPMVEKSGRSRGADRVSEYPDPGELVLDPVAGPEIALRRNQRLAAVPADPFAAELGVHRPGGPAGGTGEDNEPRLQREADREEVDQVGAGEDHVPGRSRLAQLAVDARAKPQLLRVRDLVGGDDARPERAGGLERLAAPDL